MIMDGCTRESSPDDSDRNRAHLTDPVSRCRAGASQKRPAFVRPGGVQDPFNSRAFVSPMHKPRLFPGLVT